MAGTATNWNVQAITSTEGQLWAGLSIPAAGARLTLHTDGTPDATANPNAKHLGMTREGAKYMVKPTIEDYFADEFPSPIKSKVTGLEAAITAELLQVTDSALLEILSAGFGTKASGTGYEEISLGAIALVYTSIALIFPLEADPTKFGVFHLYKTRNDGGIESEIGRKKLSGLPVSFKGLAVTSRAAADTTGKWWKQV